MSLSDFKEWVEKWTIGPGMNDSHESAVKYLDQTGLELKQRGLYSGFDGTVGRGWVPILDRLAEDLIKLGWDRDLHQVKEKFGTLRFYVGTSTADMQNRIGKAAEESAETCEECGEPGKLRTGGWLKTLCNKCFRQRGKTK